MRELLRICLVPLLLPNLICLASCGQVTSGDDGGSVSSVSSGGTSGGTTTTTSYIVTTTVSVTTSLGNATCLSRTANYITHTLPQQCLRTDRVAANVTQNGSSTAASSTNATVTPEDVSSASSPGSGSDSATTSFNGTDASLSTCTSADETSTTTDSAVATADAESETDSPLDNANFLSFEEWKKQNLAKSGQSPEHFGQGRNIEGIRERPINNALESYGDEGEIDLDFSGFGAGPSAPRSSSRQSQTGTTAANVPAGELAPALRSKDAGKTCKERTNYASFDCAANVLKSNPECKSSSSVLVENKDSYMLNTCSAQNKFFIVELCDDILIDTIVLANYEFFSSMFRHFRVSVSDRYPVKMEKWKDLGTFEARNVRDVQAFLVERPQIWARYLRIEFLSHYGSEYYCPISLLRVHGTTMLEDYRHQEEVSSGDHAEEATLEIEATATPAMAQEPSASTDESAKATLNSTEGFSAPDAAAMSVNSTSSEAHLSTTRSWAIAPASTSALNATLLPLELQNIVGNESTCAPESGSIDVKATNSSMVGLSESSNAVQSNASTPALQNSTSIGNNNQTAVSTNSTAAPEKSQIATDTSRAGSASSTSSIDHETEADSSGEAASTTSAASSSSAAPSSNLSTSMVSSNTPQSSSETSRQSSSASTLAAPPQPATQESFYKSMHKRLQQLESNSTLSLQYIESQSRILRDAFSKVEKRQLNATSAFLSNVNATVMGELRGFREAYDQLWQSTVIELEGQREQYQREMLAMGGRLTLVADELVWQKRMGIVQSTLLLLCLGLVLFARQGNGYGGLEMPLMQQMVHRSQTALARAGWESPLDADAESPLSRSPVSLFRRKLWRSQTEPSGVGGGSGDVTDATDSRPESKDGPLGSESGGVEFAVVPPSPPAHNTDTYMVSTNGYPGVDGLDEDDEDEEEEEEAEFEDVWESRSGPSTPRGTREAGRESSSEFDLGESGGGVGWLDPSASGGGGDG